MASRITAAWQRLYDVQTRTLADTAANDLGTRQATVGTVTGDCILGVVGLSDDLQLDGYTQGGEYSFMMLASAFDVAPEAQCTVRLPNVAAALVLKDFDFNNGVFQGTAIDPSKR
jgi:hypothetical protein